MVTIIVIAIIAGVGVAGFWYYRSTRGDDRRVGLSAPAAAGWHGDPTGRNESRYWDGSAWTTQVSTAGIDSNDPL